MKIKREIGIFITDYSALFCAVFLIQVFFFGALFYIKGIWLEEIFYFSFLVFIVLLIFLCWDFYKRRRVYEKLLMKSENPDDYLIQAPRSGFEKKFNLMIYEMIQNNNIINKRHKQDKNYKKLWFTGSYTK